jgi:hypothetical protein
MDASLSMPARNSATASEVLPAATDYLAQGEGKPSRGLWGEGQLLAAQAALEAAAGRTSEAVALFRAGMDKLASIEARLIYGLCGLLMLKALGADHPAARKAGEEALAIFEAMGSPPLIRQVREALGESAPAVTDSQPKPLAETPASEPARGVESPA